jgi:23S rRNA (guanosine2251-2'-O)-methyltransferase
VYGVHAALALIAKRPQSIVSAAVLADAADERLAGIVAALTEIQIPVTRMTRPELERLSGGGVHQGVVIQARTPQEFTLRDFEALVGARGRELRALALDGVQDPRNLGACLRTAEAAGVDVVIVPRGRSAALTAAAEKAATGAADTVPLLRANLARALVWLKEAGVWVVGLEAGRGRSLYQARLEAPMGFVLGGEERGLRHLTREVCDDVVSIPMRGTMASLNVSVAAGIALFELDRRLRAANEERA